MYQGNLHSSCRIPILAAALMHTTSFYRSDTAGISTRGSYNLGASEDVHQQLVWRKCSLGLTGNIKRALTDNVGEESENRGHGMALNSENLHLYRK